MNKGVLYAVAGAGAIWLLASPNDAEEPTKTETTPIPNQTTTYGDPDFVGQHEGPQPMYSFDPSFEGVETVQKAPVVVTETPAFEEPTKQVNDDALAGAVGPGVCLRDGESWYGTEGPGAEQYGWSDAGPNECFYLHSPEDYNVSYKYYSGLLVKPIKGTEQYIEDDGRGHHLWVWDHEYIPGDPVTEEQLERWKESYAVPPKKYCTLRCPDGYYAAWGAEMGKVECGSKEDLWACASHYQGPSGERKLTGGDLIWGDEVLKEAPTEQCSIM